MDTLAAMARGRLAEGQPLMVFDWEKAARLIVERKPMSAGAGLADDWEYTGGTIYTNGDPVTTSYTYLTSTWAIPQLDMDGDVIECWRLKSDSPGWDCSTKWPPEALKILRGEAA